MDVRLYNNNHKLPGIFIYHGVVHLRKGIAKDLNRKKNSGGMGFGGWNASCQKYKQLGFVGESGTVLSKLTIKFLEGNV